MVNKVHCLMYFTCVCKRKREREKLALERRLFHQEVTGSLSTTAEASLDMTVKSY